MKSVKNQMSSFEIAVVSECAVVQTSVSVWVKLFEQIYSPLELEINRIGCVQNDDWKSWK